MFNQKLRFIFLLPLTLFLISCGNTYRVATDFDEDYDFSGFRSFTIDTPDDLVHMMDDLAQARIEETLVEQLVGRGFVESGGDQADMIVSYFSTNEDGTDIETYQNYNGYYGYNSCFRCRRSAFVGVPFPTTEIRTVDYTEGVLLIDFIEPGSNRLKWRGQTTLRLSRREADSLTAAERNEIVDEAVKSILDEFPPGYEPPQ